MSLASLVALPLARSGSLAWNPHLQPRAAALALALSEADPVSLSEAVADLWAGRLSAMARGIAAYRAHPYRRDLADPPTIWSEGTARLLDYRPAGGSVVLFVPSLINRAYILDLSKRRSLLRHLASRGVRPLLLDWGEPDEPTLSVADLIDGRLSRALAAATALQGGAVALAGYCMGGTMATGLAALRPDSVRALALLAAPWDFRAYGDAVNVLSRLADKVPKDGFVPVDQLQILFLGSDPDLVVRKFQTFADLDPASEAAADFVALEDWANDGVPLAAAAARECFRDWFGANLPGQGRWRIGGRAVRPGVLATPTLVAVPGNDRLVPPESALALARALPHAEVLRPAGAHVGMVVGPEAQPALWAPLGDWLLRHAVPRHASNPSPRRALRRSAALG